MLLSGGALATNYIYTTNAWDNTGQGSPGLRITLGTKSAGGYSDVPCRSNHVEVSWNDEYGASTGLSRDQGYPSHDNLWAAVQEETTSDDCDHTNGCIGVGIILDVGDTGVVRVMHPTWDKTSPATPDALGDEPDAIVADKRDVGN